ncbi:MAG: efflux RND transporter periplasmic adaptor subunit [Rhodocyclaceae bacterium]|nr:efflux RND transporter periplasmic adaptor subunit [Rhodocyclaceae bacterium]
MKNMMFLFAALIAVPALAQAPQTPQTLVLQSREVELTYPAESVVEAVRQATVAAQVAGRIVDMRTDAGRRVKAGEVLMRIDAREAAEGLAGAQAQLAQAQANYTRTRNLFEKKFISGAALDKAEADLKSARAASGQAGAGLSYATVTAPIAGVVAQRLVELGEMAALGKPLVTVFDPRSLRVIASVPQYKLADLRGAAKAKVEFPETGKWIDAVRVELLPALDARSHTVTARVYLPDDAVGIMPGMAARVHFVSGHAMKLTLPPAAVVRRGEVSAVYVVDAQGAPHLRQVRLGEAVAGGELEVMAGLAAGDKVSLEPVKSGIALKQGN